MWVGGWGLGGQVIHRIPTGFSVSRLTDRISQRAKSWTGKKNTRLFWCYFSQLCETVSLLFSCNTSVLILPKLLCFNTVSGQFLQSDCGGEARFIVTLCCQYFHGDWNNNLLPGEWLKESDEASDREWRDAALLALRVTGPSRTGGWKGAKSTYKDLILKKARN